MVDTAPKRRTAAAYSSQTGSGTGMVVRVDEIVAVILVAGEMHLLHALDGNRAEVFVTDQIRD